jgi:DNA-binding NarL/FixJ family response regulator
MDEQRHTTDERMTTDRRGPTARERRSTSLRRTTDQRSSVLCELAVWLANQEGRSGLIVVDEQRHVLLINEQGHRQLAQVRAMRLDGDKLEFASERHHAMFLHLTSRGASTQTLRSGATIAMRALRSVATAQHLVAITITAARPSWVERVRTQFGLTNAEVQVALGIFRGSSLVEIARTRQASINTVKTQARHVFQKCRVHSQSALTRRITDTAAANGPGLGQSRWS